jgi:hypothetical protein
MQTKLHEQIRKNNCVIYTNESNDKEVRLYVLKAIPKVGALSQANKMVQRDDD